MKESESLNRIFHALADPTRRAILAKLAEREITIGELAEPFKMTLAAVSKHVRVLEKAGFIRREIDGRIHRCSAELEPFKNISAFVDRYKKYWNGQLDVLEKYLRNSPNPR